MLKKAIVAISCIASFCFADNFLIGNSIANHYGMSDAVSSHKVESVPDAHQPAKAHNDMPQRVVIEDINPSSELGQLITLMLKNEKKKAAQLAAPKPKPKPIVKKKPVKKKVVKKKVVPKKPVVVDPHMEIKSEEASKVPEHDKKEAEHNENNSSLKKISSSNICS